MPSKVHHSKSRHSCSRCKLRRVKCDLQAPCTNCRRRQEDCSLTSARTSRLISAEQQASFSPSPVAHDGSRQLRLPDDFAFLSLLVPILAEQSPPRPLTWTEDLFLMSHFTSATSYTLSHREADQHMWRVVIPEMAIPQPFLMHGLLAVSAMHLSYLRQNERTKYEMQSSYHQALATSQLRSVLTNITSENCSAAFALCALLTLISMIYIARRTDAERERSGTGFIDDIVHHFMLTRGIGGVLADHWVTILSGPLRILSTDKLEDPDTYTLSPQIDQQFLALRERLIPSLGSTDPAALQTCLDALAGLELVYKHCYFLHPHLPRAKLEIGVALRWMSLVPAEYMALLKQRNTMALILLAHFIVLFANFGDEWFLQGWCEQAMKSIETIVSEQGYAGLKWPLEQLKEKHAHTSA
ncbi:hypothetical protein DPSP01_006484 [Paraphaeosphaeria sporulosa]|uniref:Zn(2)-C6 fungal-type domain-containing protein n=1 Tax=Paraphaeosphaeria sporulosa TaxID=1460663 RepID=A0A177CMZ9_9PLEO|nr:uncharacterized protein CC84DRAFT_1203957 [Paraphaeosphaeria sporulosa]OAG08631.1 hypothetical protein CC84DRAFT_1203957 [Paraphaeosphaeria sporulosa]